MLRFELLTVSKPNILSSLNNLLRKINERCSMPAFMTTRGILTGHVFMQDYRVHGFTVELEVSVANYGMSGRLRSAF